MSLAVAGERDQAWQLLHDAARPEAGSTNSPLTRGLVHAAFAEMDEAFPYVEQAIDQRDPMLRYLMVHPMFDTLRARPSRSGLLRI